VDLLRQSLQLRERHLPIGHNQRQGRVFRRLRDEVIVAQACSDPGKDIADQRAIVMQSISSTTYYAALSIDYRAQRIDDGKHADLDRAYFAKCATLARVRPVLGRELLGQYSVGNSLFNLAT
jgi:hypothetical protein